MYILASDFDGTLNYHGISEKNREAIKKFRAAGNKFGLVTGRDYWMYETLVKEQIEFDFVLALNGAMAVNTDGSFLWCERTENKNGTVRGIAEYLGEEWHTYLSCLLERKRHTFCTSEEYVKDTLRTEEADKIVEFTHLNTIFPKDEDAEKATAEINRRWGDTVNALQNGRCIDIPPKGIDKGQGVARYAELIGVPADNIYCVGDNMNDMAMITRFHGCAVANARKEVKDATEAEYEGVWAVIEHILSL